MLLGAKLHCFCGDGFELIVPSSIHVEVVLQQTETNTSYVWLTNDDDDDNNNK